MRYTIRLKEEIFDQALNSGSRGREGRDLKSGIPSRQETDEGFWKALSFRMMLASFFLVVYPYIGFKCVFDECDRFLFREFGNDIQKISRFVFVEEIK